MIPDLIYEIALVIVRDLMESKMLRLSLLWLRKKYESNALELFCMLERVLEDDNQSMSEKKMSSKLQRALENLVEKGVSLDNLPTDREATDWNVIAEETSLEQLELVALKTHKEQQLQQVSLNLWVAHWQPRLGFTARTP